MKKLLLLALIVTGCGFKVSGIPSKVEGDAKVGPDFEGAAAFCDNRYGKGTQEAEDCFLDYRHYFDIQISLDLTSIQKYCEQNYTDPVARQGCIDDLTDILHNAATGH